MHKTGLFFKTVFFPEFRSIKAIFRSIEIVLKILTEPLSVLINQKSWISFLKIWFWLVQLIFFKKISNFSFSLRLDKGYSSNFCRFPPIFLQGFPLPRPVRPFYPSFCIYFHVSCIKSCILLGFSDLFKFGVFNDSSFLFWNWSLGFVPIML